MKRLLLPLLAALALSTAVNAGLDSRNTFDNRAYAVGVIWIQNCVAEKGWKSEQEAFVDASKVIAKKGLNPMIFVQDERVIKGAKILTDICVRKIERNAESLQELRKSYEFRSAFDEVGEIIK
tara:strand:- start:137 stop:505 length:369 start_codon:yes stop_codon:yes gene_type:complete